VVATVVFLYNRSQERGDIMGVTVMSNMVFLIVLSAVLAILFIGFVILVVRALLKYIRTNEVRKEKSEIMKSLGETLKGHRNRCKMTQEFVAEAIGVSRQAVSKWENGISDPSTSNLFTLVKLYGISAEDLLKEVNR
jgi:DNA-binding XRE family transcriptional regulator